MLGEAAQGIYHLRWAYSDTNKHKWIGRDFIELCADTSGLSFDTVDADSLTRLVFLAHDYGIRMEIRPRTFRHLSLLFSQRTLRQNSMSGHPTIEQALADYRSFYPVEAQPCPPPNPSRPSHAPSYHPHPTDAATLTQAAALLREQERRLERVEALLKKWEAGTERLMQQALAQDDIQEAVRLGSLVGAREYCNDALREALAQAPAGQEGEVEG